MSETAKAPRSLFGHMDISRIWVPLFMMTGISLLSGSAGVQVGPLSFVGIDKVGHFVVFGLLGIAWSRCLLPFVSRARRLILATALTTLFGLLDELHQFHNPERTFEWADLLADGCGAFIVAASYLYIKPWHSFLELRLGKLLHLPFRKNTTNSVE